MEAKPEVFLSRVPGSNFSGGTTNIVFSPDPMNQSRGRYETSDPREIAELHAAIKSGAPTIYQDPREVPYAKSANPVEAAEQQRNVDEAEKEIQARKEEAARKLREGVQGQGQPAKPGEAKAVEGANDSVRAQQQNQGTQAPFIPPTQQQGVGGIVNTTSLNQSGAVQNQSPAQLAAARAAEAAKQNK